MRFATVRASRALLDAVDAQGPSHAGDRTLCNLQVNMQVECDFVKDTLRGDEVNEIRLKLISEGTEAYPFKDDD